MQGTPRCGDEDQGKKISRGVAAVSLLVRIPVMLHCWCDAEAEGNERGIAATTHLDLQWAKRCCGWHTDDVDKHRRKIAASRLAAAFRRLTTSAG
jgi:hypothetical protein